MVVIEGITRRKALKTGALVTGGFALGGSAVGTVGANGMKAVAEIEGEHHFVRAEGDEEDPVSPKPDPQDPLVERREGNPVDDGTDEENRDGTHQLRWGEFRAVNGHVMLDCRGEGTDVRLKATGLIPNGLYTLWVIVFESPGFDFGSRDIFPFGADGTAAENVIAAGALGHLQEDVEQGEAITNNVFEARGSHGELSANQPGGKLTLHPLLPTEVKDWLLNEFEVHIVGDFHLDGRTYDNGGPGPAGHHIEHFGAVFKEGEPL